MYSILGYNPSHVPEIYQNFLFGPDQRKTLSKTPEDTRGNRINVSTGTTKGQVLLLIAGHAKMKEVKFPS